MLFYEKNLGIYFSSVNLTKFANVLEKLKAKPCICKIYSHVLFTDKFG